MRIFGRKALFLLLLVGALVLSACAGGGDSSPTAAPVFNGETTSPQSNQGGTSAVEATGVEAPGFEPPPTLSPGSAQPGAETVPATEAVESTAEGEPTTAVETDAPAEPAAASVSEIPSPDGFTWAPVVSGLERPLDLTDPADGTNRLFVVEKVGRIRVVTVEASGDGSLLPEPFLDISDRVGLSGNERGLLGIALHPDYLENGFFYLNYTDLNGNTVISRFSVTGDPNIADPGSEKVLLTYNQPFANHNGGVVTFGPDGYLYIGSGDGGSANDPNNNGQSLDALLGKILRIDVDGGDPYAIPADNPFAGGGGEAEIWAYGLRNPWRISFDSLTGDLYIADVGQGNREEIDFEPAGSAGGINYGWKYKEGTLDANGGPPANFEAVGPVAEYDHSLGCSVTGGFVYRGEALPEFYGVYLYADYCSGKMWALLRGAGGGWQGREMYQLDGVNVTSFGQDSRGELYITDDNGGVYRLQRR